VAAFVKKPALVIRQLIVLEVSSLYSYQGHALAHQVAKELAGVQKTLTHYTSWVIDFTKLHHAENKIQRLSAEKLFDPMG